MIYINPIINSVSNDELSLTTHLLPETSTVSDVAALDPICTSPRVSQKSTPPSCCCLPSPMTLASGGESDVPACGPPASFSVHLASSAVTSAGSVHKSRGDNVVRMWVQLKR